LIFYGPPVSNDAKYGMSPNFRKLTYFRLFWR
jgi:hypothetical protein